MKRSPRSSLLAGTVAILAVTSFVAACGGDDDDAATTTTGATTDERATDATVDTTGGSDDSTADGGSAGGDEEAYVNALRDNIRLEDEEMSTCLARAVVDAVGLDRIKDSGLSPDEFANSNGQLSEEEPALTPDKSDQLQADFLDCGALADAFLSASDAPEEQKACEREVITDEIAAAVLANQLTGAENSEEVAAAVEQAGRCTGESSGAATTTTG